MVANSKRAATRLLRLLAGTCFVWALVAAAPVYAYDYGRGTYGSGAYNVGQLDATNTVLASGTNPSTVGDSIRLTATVTPGTATGTVTFKNGGTTIGTATLAQGSGSLSTSALTAGSHSLTAVYGGNLTYSGSTSNTLTQVVNAAAGSSSSSSTGGNSGESGGGGGGRRSLSGVYSSSSAAGGQDSGPESTDGGALPDQRGNLAVTIDGKIVVFRDVPVRAWYAGYVYTLVRAGIASGYKDQRGRLTGFFKPGDAVTRAEVLKMALLSAGKPLSSGLPRNRSAKADWSAPYVKTAEDLGMSVYVTSLDVRKPSTRGEVIQTLLEAFDVDITGGENPFSDLPISHRHSDAILTAYRLGIITGDTDAQGNMLGTVRPEDPVNRAEAAKVIALAMDVQSR